MIINLISGPRNISTALMYSFAQRPDTVVIDEPFYGDYLLRFNPGHPGQDEIIAAMLTDPELVKKRIADKAAEAPLVFVKNMGHHLLDIDVTFLENYTNIFLVRDPGPLIASLAEIIHDPIIRDVGLERQAELFVYLSEKTGKTPIVIDSHEVLANPKAMLRKICERLNIPYTDAMLSWPKGTVYDDVPWAKYWYKNVMDTNSFEKQVTSTRPFPERCLPLLETAKKYYAILHQHALKP